MRVRCVSASEHVWVGAMGLSGGGGLPAGGIRASQGTFSSCCYLFGLDFVVGREMLIKSLYMFGWDAFTQGQGSKNPGIKP